MKISLGIIMGDKIIQGAGIDIEDVRQLEFDVCSSDFTAVAYMKNGRKYRVTEETVKALVRFHSEQSKNNKDSGFRYDWRGNDNPIPYINRLFEWANR